jgi:lipopolysaccharide export system permease protein
LGLSVVTFFLTTDFLLDYLELFISKGIPFLTVLRLYGLGLGWMLALSIPCSVLVGVLMTYGRMAQDNEVMAAQAGGVSVFHLVAPAFAWAAVVGAGLTLFNNYVLPETNHAFATQMLQINKTRPTARIQEGTFIKDFPGYNLFINKLDDRTGRMRDVLIFDTTQGLAQARTILADRGHLSYRPDQGLLVLELEDGEVHEAEASKGGTAYRRARFEKQTLHIIDADRLRQTTLTRQRSNREMSIPMMRGKIAELVREKARYRVERDSSLAALGLRSMAQIPGTQPKPPFLARWMSWLRPAPVDSVLPDSLVGPKERRWIEEAKMREFQSAAADKEIAQFKVEIHKKLSIPAACLVFALLGAPLGVKARRGGVAVGFLSVGFFLLYYLFLVGGEQLADRGRMAPWLSMWLPNIVLGAAGLYLTLKTCQVAFRVRRA